MMTKLTLSMNEQVIKRAKEYAKASDRSLSEIIENFLRAITADSPMMEVGPMTRQLKGCVKLPEDFDMKTSLKDIISKKYR